METTKKSAPTEAGAKAHSKEGGKVRTVEVGYSARFRMATVPDRWVWCPIPRPTENSPREFPPLIMSAPEDAQETLIPAITFALDALAQIRARAEAVADAGSTHED